MQSEAQAACNSPDFGQGTFYATQASGPGFLQCSDTVTDTNDLFGCGTLGAQLQQASCGVLNRIMADGICRNETGGTWQCDLGGGFAEHVVVTKPGNAGGGALCCRGAGSSIAIDATTLDSCEERPTISGVAFSLRA